MNLDVRKLVKDKIAELGLDSSKDYFGVSIQTLSNWTEGKTNPSVDAIQRVVSELPEVVSSHPDPITMWNGRKVMMLLPSYKYVNPDTHFTLFANYASYGPEKIGMMIEKGTLIHEARNILIHKFLKTDIPWCIMGDDDMVIPCGNVNIFNGNYKAGVPDFNAGLHSISRLMSHPDDLKIVGALYFGRHEEGVPQCQWGFTNPQENDALRGHHKYHGPIKQEWVGTGFIKIHRSVFETMKQAIDAGMFPECKPLGEDLWYGFFAPEKVGVGEDVSFGRRATRLGIHSYVDAALECLHVGDRMYGSRNTKNKP